MSWGRVMKRFVKVIILLQFVFIFGCSSEGSISLERDKGQNATALYSKSQIVIPDGEDPGLFLYRNKMFSPLVVDFYTRVTGSRRIALPIIEYSDKYNIPLSLSFALAWVESHYNPRAVNRNYGSIDRGLFQLNSRTFRFLRRSDFFDPRINAKYGIAHLRFCLNTGKDEIVGLAMYNAGTVGVKKGTPLSTLRYVSKIIRYRKHLDELFKREVLGEGKYVLNLRGNEDS